MREFVIWGVSMALKIRYKKTTYEPFKVVDDMEEIQKMTIVWCRLMTMDRK